MGVTGTEAQKEALRGAEPVARPWDPATCTLPNLRKELWDWLEAVVTWLNAEYVWDVSGAIPACWPHHPHLVHEIAVLADKRRRAGRAYTSDDLEEWHRLCLPLFVERMRVRLRSHCDDGHQAWPATGRQSRFTGESAAADRGRAYEADKAALPPPATTEDGRQRPLYAVADEDTHEDVDDGEEPP